MNSLSEADWLSEPHPLSEATSSLSGCKTLEEDKSERSMHLARSQLAQLGCCLFSRLARPSSLSGFSLTLA